MNESELILKMRSARGAYFASLFRQADATIGERLRNEVVAQRASSGVVSFRFLGMLAVRENLPVKTLFRMLEATPALPCGTYEAMIERGVTPTQLLEAGRAALESAKENPK